MVSSHSTPAETCRPWHPTSEKNALRNALRDGTITARDEIGEFAKLDGKEDQPEHAGHGHAEVEPEPVAHVGRNARHAAGKARQQQADRLDRDIALLENLRALGAAGGLVNQHRIGRKEAGEHHDVGEQEYPEAIGGHDALRRRPGMLDDEPDLMGIGLGVAGRCGHRHQTVPAMLTRLRRSSRLTRSIAATSAAANDVFVMVTPGEHDEGRERADAAQNHHPPDVPDQREAHDGGEERADETGRRVPGHLDVVIFGHGTIERLLLGA